MSVCVFFMFIYSSIYVCAFLCVCMNACIYVCMHCSSYICVYVFTYSLLYAFRITRFSSFIYVYRPMHSPVHGRFRHACAGDTLLVPPSLLSSFTHFATRSVSFLRHRHISFPSTSSSARRVSLSPFSQGRQSQFPLPSFPPLFLSIDNSTVFFFPLLRALS